KRGVEDACRGELGRNLAHDLLPSREARILGMRHEGREGDLLYLKSGEQRHRASRGNRLPCRWAWRSLVVQDNSRRILWPSGLSRGQKPWRLNLGKAGQFVPMRKVHR